MRIEPRAGLLSALSVIAIAVAACGGGTSSASPGSSAAPAATPTTAPASAPTGSTAPSAAIALPSFDLEGLVQNLQNVDSYKIAITSGGEVKYSGTVVTKPVLARDVTIGGQHIVTIGDQTWIDTGAGMQPAPSSAVGALLSAFDPSLLIGAFSAPGAMVGATDRGSEEKNGVQAKHYSIESGSIVGTLASMPPGAKIDMWIANDGYLVSLAVTGMTEGDFSLDVTNVNDPANKVEAPS